VTSLTGLRHYAIITPERWCLMAMINPISYQFMMKHSSIFGPASAKDIVLNDSLS
jgi:hypothetical protein